MYDMGLMIQVSEIYICGIYKVYIYIFKYTYMHQYVYIVYIYKCILYIKNQN